MVASIRRNVICIILILYVLLQNICVINTALRFTSIKCDLYDPEFGAVKECHIKAINRQKTSMSVRVELLKTINSLTIHFKLWKRANGWRPFLCEFKQDMCAFFRNPQKYLVVFAFFSFAKNYLNLNHTCPYVAGEEWIMDSWELKEDDLLNKLPFEIGEYLGTSKWYVNKKFAAMVNASIAYSDYRKIY